MSSQNIEKTIKHAGKPPFWAGQHATERQHVCLEFLTLYLQPACCIVNVGEMTAPVSDSPMVCKASLYR